MFESSHVFEGEGNLIMSTHIDSFKEFLVKLFIMVYLVFIEHFIACAAGRGSDH